jgi:hypothetical protein
VVQEPAQGPKIKIKVGQGAETPTPAKKITIHVGGRGGSVDSPAPQGTDTTGSPANGLNVNGTTRPPAAAAETTRSGSTSAGSPTSSSAPVAKPEDSIVAPSPSKSQQVQTASMPVTQSHFAPPPTPVAPPRAQIPAVPMEPRPLRAPGQGVEHALISKLQISTYAVTPADSANIVVLPHPRETQQSVIYHLPSTVNRATIVLTLPDFLVLEDRHLVVWTLINKQVLHPAPLQTTDQLPLELKFDVLLHPGTNTLETHVCAGKALALWVPGASNNDLEIFNVHLQVARG